MEKSIGALSDALAATTKVEMSHSEKDKDPVGQSPTSQTMTMKNSTMGLHYQIMLTHLTGRTRPSYLNPARLLVSPRLGTLKRLSENLLKT